MAPPAGNPALRRMERLLRLLAPVPGRLEFASRLALICALTALVTEIYQTPDPALTVYVAFFLIKPDRVTSIVTSLIMLSVMTVTLLIILLATIAVADQPVWRVCVMAALSFGLVFLASASKLRPIAPIVALIAAYALDLLGTVRIGEIATRALLYAWLFVAIPAGLTILVNLLIGPAPRRLATRALAHRLRLSAALLRAPNQTIHHEFQAALREGVGEILTWLRLAGAEKTSPAADLAALHQAGTATMRIMLLADMARSAPENMPAPGTCGHVAGTLDDMAAILETGAYPVEIELAEPESAPASPVASAWFAEMRANLVQFAIPSAPPPGAPPAEKPHGGFLLPDAFSNPVHVHHALKTTGAAMFCYILYSLLDWPTIHTCLITCYIVSLGTAAETVEKLGLRILGCMVGAAAGIAAIVFLVPALTSIGALMITVFAAALISAWVAVGDARIAYAGFQMAFAFFLCVIQGTGPSFDMVTARDRVIGILLGNLVVYLISTNIWPVSVVHRIDPEIAAVLRKLGALLGSKDQAASLAASQAQTAFASLEHDLDLAAYEPASIRPARDWLERRRHAVDDLAALESTFLLCAARDPDLSHGIAFRLGHFADALDGTRAPKSADPGTKDASPLAMLRNQIDARLESFETLSKSMDHQGAMLHAPA